jgi:L-aspartate oxidase
MRQCDVLIAGSGMAGLMCALTLPGKLKVTILSKTPLPAGSPYLAQGGIAAVSSGEDSPEMHLADTVRAGAGLVDQRAAMEIIRRGKS